MPRALPGSLTARIGRAIFGEPPTFRGMRQPDLAYAPGVEVYRVPEMGAEGFQWRNRVYLGPLADAGMVGHELEHAEQARRWGPFYPLLDLLLSRVGVGYEQNPFERAATARERQIRAAGYKARR